GLSPPLAEDVLQHNPELPYDESETCQSYEFRKVTPRHIVVLRCIDRKILTPLRLLIIRAAIWRYCSLFSIRLSHLLSSLELKNVKRYALADGLFIHSRSDIYIFSSPMPRQHHVYFRRYHLLSELELISRY